MKYDFTVALIWSFLTTNAAQHLFMCVLAVCMSSFVKCLSKSYFKDGFLCHRPPRKLVAEDKTISLLAALHSALGLPGQSFSSACCWLQSPEAQLGLNTKGGLTQAWRCRWGASLHRFPTAVARSLYMVAQSSPMGHSEETKPTVFLHQPS